VCSVHGTWTALCVRRGPVYGGLVYQAGGARAARDNAEVFVTVDSDTSLERRAIEEGLKPFTDPRCSRWPGSSWPALLH
jgi:hypothetical protein